MTRVIVDISPSVDGFVAGDDVSVEQPFGDAGLVLYRWLGLEGDEPSEPDRAAAEWQLGDAGAIVLGRTMFDVGIGPWGEDGAFHRPVFVVTNRPHEPVVKGPTTFTFVTDGLQAAIDHAKAASGERDVLVVGGARVVDQCIEDDLVDEIRLHVAPILLGSGTRLFRSTQKQPPRRLKIIEATTTDAAIHVRYRVIRSADPTS